MIASQFPILQKLTYLNTASCGLISNSLYAWRRQHDLEFLQEGSLFRDQQEEGGLLPKCKKLLAGFFEAPPDHVVLVPNFSFAFNTILSSLANEHRFLLLEEEYPSIWYPIASRGLKHETVLADAHLEERILDAIKTFKPTVFVFSLVQYISGIKIDFDFIKKLKTDHPEILLIADGTQYCGTEPFSFQDSGLDMLISSGYKWMLAGYGNGFMLLSEEGLSSLKLVEEEVVKPNLAHLQGKSDLSFRFEPGHQDTLTYGSLKHAVEFFNQIDFVQETLKLNKLADSAKKEFEARNLLEEAVVNRKNHSTIFNLKGGTDLYNRLKVENMVCIPRGQGIRLGFHIYNDEDDLEKLLKTLDVYRKA